MQSDNANVGCCGGNSIVDPMNQLIEQAPEQLSTQVTEDAQTLSVVVPIFNEIAVLPALLAQLAELRADQLILVDGGSNDGSYQWLEQHKDKAFTLLQTASGRALQMNAGAAQCTSDMIVFLHADTMLPKDAKKEILAARNNLRLWGRFDIAFSDVGSNRIAMPVVAWFMNVRSRLSSIATGDQAIFVDRQLYNIVGGFPNLPVMEDVALCKQLKRHCVPACSRLKAITSARRWQQNGVIKTVLLMWALRLAFAFGVSPQRLAQIYQQVR